MLADGRLLTVNKLPDNFLYIGLIRLILPNARIIHTVRNPLDTCLSCYSTLFTSGQHFSYDLPRTGPLLPRLQRTDDSLALGTRARCHARRRL